MRISASIQHPDWHPIASNRNLKVYLNDVLQQACVFADEEAGVVEVLVDPRPGYHSPGVLPTEKRHGAVRIELPVGFEHLRLGASVAPML